jgi:hypothetical protein
VVDVQKAGWSQGRARKRLLKTENRPSQFHGPVRGVRDGICVRAVRGPASLKCFHNLRLGCLGPGTGVFA